MDQNIEILNQIASSYPKIESLLSVIDNILNDLEATPAENSISGPKELPGAKEALVPGESNSNPTGGSTAYGSDATQTLLSTALVTRSSTSSLNETNTEVGKPAVELMEYPTPQSPVEVKEMAEGSEPYRPLPSHSRTAAKHDREQLYADVWEMPLDKAAARHGIAPVTLARICRKLKVPTPPSGFWSKVAAGQPTPLRPALPLLESLPSSGHYAEVSFGSSDQQSEQSSPPGHAREAVEAGCNSPCVSGRYDRNRLYDQVWEKPMQKLSREYGVSGTALRKTCRRLNVPVPPQGYWNKILAGKPVSQRTELPSASLPRSALQARRTPEYSIDQKEWILSEINQRLAAGETLALACKKSGISQTTFRRWRPQKPAAQLPDSCESPLAPSDIQREMEAALGVPEGSTCLDDRQSLFVAVWREPLYGIAKRLGLSADTLSIKCKQLQIPVPPSGYFQRMKFGLPLQQRPELPPIPNSNLGKKEWKSNTYSAEQIEQKSAVIRLAIAAGDPLEAACRRAGIAITTYRRWCKRMTV